MIQISLWGISQYTTKLHKFFSFYSAIPFLGIYPKDTAQQAQKDVCTNFFSVQ